MLSAPVRLSRMIARLVGRHDLGPVVDVDLGVVLNVGDIVDLVQPVLDIQWPQTHRANRAGSASNVVGS
jgi:hypothetical protein